MSDRIHTKPERRRNTKLDLAQSAAGLMKDHGYRGTSIDTIVKAAAVTKPTFYYHYASKLELLTELLEDSMGRIEKALARADDPSLPPDQRLRMLVAAYALEVLDRPDMWTVYLGERDRLDPDRARTIRRRERTVVALLEKVITDGINLGVFKDLNPLVAAMGLIGLVSWLHRWYQDRGNANKTMIVDQYSQMAVDALRAS
jgi:AcrR family transcriptional regulator